MDLAVLFDPEIFDSGDRFSARQAIAELDQGTFALADADHVDARRGDHDLGREGRIGAADDGRNAGIPDRVQQSDAEPIGHFDGRQADQVGPVVGDRLHEILDHVRLVGLDAEVGEIGFLDLQRRGSGLVAGDVRGAVKGRVEHPHLMARLLDASGQDADTGGDQGIEHGVAIDE